MIRDAQASGGFSVILCWDQDRFGRFDALEANHYWYVLREAGVVLHTVAQGIIKTEDLGEWLKASVTQHGKHQYLIDLSRNVLRGQLSAVLQRKMVVNSAYGYDRLYVDPAGNEMHRASYGERFTKPKDWEIQLVLSHDTEAVATLRWLFRTFARTDQSCRALARILNERGVPGPRNGPGGKR
jgi:DNA invertase Pin-like site-specific DNA recombinase